MHFYLCFLSFYVLNQDFSHCITKSSTSPDTTDDINSYLYSECIHFEQRICM